MLILTGMGTEWKYIFAGTNVDGTVLNGDSSRRILILRGWIGMGVNVRFRAGLY